MELSGNVVENEDILRSSIEFENSQKIYEIEDKYKNVFIKLYYLMIYIFFNGVNSTEYY